MALTLRAKVPTFPVCRTSRTSRGGNGKGQLRAPCFSRRHLVSSRAQSSSKRTVRKVAVSASGDENNPRGLTRENEPESAWLTAAEKEGKSPLVDPLAIIGILSIFFPFVILGIAFGAGLIELP